MKKKTGNILVVDDNVAILESLKQLLKYDFETIATEKNPENIEVRLLENNYDVILLDMNFKPASRSGEEGLRLIGEILSIDAEAVIILITAYGDIELAVKAIRAGGYDFIVKPWEPKKIITTLQAAVKYRNTKRELSALKSQRSISENDLDIEFGEIIAFSTAMKEILDTVEKVAHTDANILISGEHGTGKEIIAREIHKRSLRSSNSFVKIDLGAIPESLFESEMFGHTRGAFTDARSDRQGRFEAAQHGTLFLDEIGNLPLTLQSKILSALQNRTIIRVGSNKPIPINVRLISASNRNLAECVVNKEFRQDLLYRINTIQIQLPPLRQRKEDILPLAFYFLKRFEKKYQKSQMIINKISEEFLLSYPWPGNIRELKHTIEKAVILSDSKYLNFDNQLPETPMETENEKFVRLADVEKNTIQQALTMANGNISKAAQLLEISRTTLYSKMQKHDL